ncbi:MAG: hypothetical protein JNL58_01150 [Planctomyces sp.]|nr:hypothetical protein [Planctomyces sp.]
MIRETFSDSSSASGLTSQSQSTQVSEVVQPVWQSCVLARYGAVPQVARFVSEHPAWSRGDRIVVRTDRGLEIATVLQNVRIPENEEWTGEAVRLATASDEADATQVQREAAGEFSAWIQRVGTWKLQLELIDLEWTLDRQRIFYVLNDRGAETTRMALLAAAGGFGIVHVQPVSAEGVVTGKTGGGCGTGSCGCSTEGGNHHHH